MTEISKMFENANAYKMLCNCEFKNLYDYRIEYGSDVCDYTESKIKEPCKVCEKAKQKIKYYPDFTAEKQIELIKKLGNINIDIDNGCYMSSEILEVEAHCDEFEETLAEFVNNLWQDLTDQEKEEIRNILNA